MGKRFPNYHPQIGTYSTPDVLNLIGRNDGCFKALADFMVEEGDGEKLRNGRVLVVGSGSGELPKYLSKRFENPNIMSLDIALGVLRRGSKNPTCADVCHLPFSDESFEAVVAHGVFRYVRKINSLQEVNRVLNGGGVAYISEGKDMGAMGDGFSKLTDPSKGVLGVEPESFRIDGVKMPRLTLFYALLENVKKDSLLRREVEKRKKRGKRSETVILFEMAGESVDYVFGVKWKKRNKEV